MHLDYSSYPSLGPKSNECSGRCIRIRSLNIDGFVTLKGHPNKMDDVSLGTPGLGGDVIMGQPIEDHDDCKFDVRCLYIMLDSKPNSIIAPGPSDVFDVGIGPIRLYIDCHVNSDMINRLRVMCRETLIC